MDNQTPNTQPPQPVAPAVSAASPPAPASAPAPAAQTQSYVAPNGKSWSKLPLVIAVILATFILAGVAYYISQNQSAFAPSAKQTTVVPEASPTVVPTITPTDTQDLNSVDVESGFKTDMTGLETDLNGL